MFKQDGNNSGNNDNKSNAPKYILALKASADARKKEREIRRFKKHTAERNPNEEFYITSKYRDKLKEYEQLCEPSNKSCGTSGTSGASTSTTRAKSYNDDNDKKYRPPCASPKPVIASAKARSSTHDVTIRDKLAKQTIGPVFEDARSRYHIRKNSPRAFPFAAIESDGLDARRRSRH